MKREVSFQLIEDSRFGDRPKIHAQIDALIKALGNLGISGGDFSISEPLRLDWKADRHEPESFQYRCRVRIRYESKLIKRNGLLTAINSAIPAPYYTFSPA